MALMGLKSSFFRAEIFVVLLIFNFCKVTQALNSDSPYYKLPSAILPTKYNLHISTLIHQNVLPYNGSVSIDITIMQPTNQIVLNAHQLQKLNISLRNLESGLTLESPYQLHYELDEVKQQLRIYWPEYPLMLKIGQQYRLKIDFVGNILEGELFGFFKSNYLNDDGEKIQTAVTQFEPISARVAFPCFDDPVIKAKFIISITHGTNYSAISNMPADGESILSSTPHGEMATTKFLETPTMPTYLIAFAVTNYKKTSIVVNGLEHRFFYPPNSKNNGSLALENAIKTVDALEKLLGIKYSLPKLDHIQFPRLYGLAMENWGLMTFQAIDVLPNQKKNVQIDFFNKIRIQNHEIAHQWFGNLVTPASWNYIWLKEGFSTYFSYVATNLVYPEYKVLESFLVNEVSGIYSSARFNEPLTSVIKEGTDIQEKYNEIPYQFGAAFLRMFHHAIGHDTFMKGIFKYLYLNQYSVANDEDFFAAMQSAVDEDKVELFQNNQSVANVMKSWTQNKGIPIVSIIRNYETGTITIRQKSRFEDETQKWWIPMSFATAAAPDFERTIADFIMPPQAEVTIDLKDLNINLSNSDWLIVNKQQTGIFLVAYDDLNLKLISEALNSNPKAIHELNRAQILKDISEIFEFDAIEPVLELLQYLRNEKESMPWFSAVDLITKLLPNLEDSKVSDEFRSFIYDLFVEFYDQKFPTALSSGDQFAATDLKFNDKIRILKFEVDTVTCRNYTTKTAIEYLTGENNATEIPCRESFCQAFQSLTFLEFLNILEEIAPNSATSGTLKTYEFLIVLKCVQIQELFQNAYENLLSNKNVDDFELFDSLLVSNQFFETWLTNFYNGEKKADAYENVIFKYRNDKIMQRKTFLKKYESNIGAWLERYEMKSQQSTKLE